MSINYELAKELKDAGFPQKTRFGSFYYHETTTEFATPKVDLWLENLSTLKQPSCDVLSPNLEELIEACGKDFIALSMSDDDSGDWCAMGTGYNLGDIEGSTPTEAVARLWLALNKKAHE